MRNWVLMVFTQQDRMFVIKSTLSLNLLPDDVQAEQEAAAKAKVEVYGIPTIVSYLLAQLTHQQTFIVYVCIISGRNGPICRANYDFFKLYSYRCRFNFANELH